MQRMMGICLWIVAGAAVTSSPAMPFTGQVVDNKARPIPGAQVVVCERDWIGGSDQDARMVSPVIQTDAQGRFTLEVDVAKQRDIFVVARKTGLAYSWEWLNGGINTLSRKHFPLVLEPACTLAGQVVDAEGRPVAGAQVQATPVNTWGFSGIVDRWAIPGPRQWLLAVTDAQGRFQFEQFAADVSAGLCVQAAGKASCYVFRRHRTESIGFEVGRQDIRLTLPKEGTVRGRVVDGQNRLVGGVELMIRPSDEYSDSTSLYLVRKATSDRTGNFSFEGVPEGSHEVRVLVPEQGPPLWTSPTENVTIKAGAIAEPTIRVDKGGVLEVTALDARTRRPIAGAHVDASGQQRRQGQVATTDARGVACVRVPTDSYTVHVSAAAFSYSQSTVKITDGQTVRREALLPPAPRVSGRVLDPEGAPAADVAVVVHPFGDHVHTDAQGRFEAGYDERHAPKLAIARAVQDGWAAAVPVGSPSKPVELRLGPAWTLTGRVADPNGAPIPAARVSLQLDIQNCVSSTGVEVLSDPAGRFEIPAIPPVQKDFEYWISANAAGYGQADMLKTFLRGRPGASVDLGAIRLPLANVSVSGVVVDAKGVPAARVPIFASGWPAEYQPHKQTATNERGEFTITRLCQGPVSFQANFGNSPGGSSHLRTRLPARSVKIVLGQKLTDVPQISSPDTRPAQLTDLCPALARLQTDGRLLLLCFVDIAQQSSKQFLMDLARKADVLDAKDVIVVVVRTSTIDIRPYDAFAKANHIPFCHKPAGDDFAARKASRGIKSVPWLILTDKKHDVVAEGFGLGELDQKLAEAFGR